MLGQASILVTLLKLIDRIPNPKPGKTKRGRPTFYPDQLFMKALVIMILRNLHTIHALLAVLEQPTTEMQQLRALLYSNGRYPSRRTFERRLAKLPEALPARIAILGGYLLARLQPWAHCGRAAAMDSTVLHAQGGVWHKRDRERGVLPHTRIDTEAHWTKSGWHGWVYGWKLHLVVTVAAVWIPLAARLTAANEADNQLAPALIGDLPEEARLLLGDVHYNAPNVIEACEKSERMLITPHYGSYPHEDEGVEVRRVFHLLRHQSIENFNEQFKAIFELHGSVPTKGWMKTTRFVLGAVLIYQLALLSRFELGLDLRVGLKPFLRSA